MTTDIANPSDLSPEAPGWLVDPARPLLFRAGRWNAGDIGRAPHSHPRGQLLWAQEGVLTVRSCGAQWLVPPSHAVWIDGDVRHSVAMQTSATTCFIYVDPSVEISGRGRCEVLHMSALMKALILRFRALSDASGEAARLTHLSAVILDELAALEAAPLSLPAGSDPRLRRVTARLLENPEDNTPLAALAPFAGASTRTLERLFVAETGLRFCEWRTRLKLMEAVNDLGQGKSSAAIAARLGYRSASAFSAAFRRQFGRPPQSFLERVDDNRTTGALRAEA
ncbi:helix-turn-helix transcriptional regulator [Martelella sp. HB161492]|uniref:AraC family transcriptional regulator n=1 Tax=Martelella sp. HB161492 TaxID=2720726 RepID=UPI00158FD63E|nr:helix-turn-helix transcriptional regulator [Martelella sp. HB161492]